eukprot:CAMPEP_0170607256 /NCGR_PEP_ID=MMETSP0224-20130122/20955_1 /TAXON_ID=285029 /ORGANISM="Togula jolla, Strain CCCM 725" /LENGTH=537 /DNA_ID=CAMNT_0010932405 /DNA_START=128 /DNA_END=1741 /DNA_ORIENTATION=+
MWRHTPLENDFDNEDGDHQLARDPTEVPAAPAGNTVEHLDCYNDPQCEEEKALNRTWQLTQSSGTWPIMWSNTKKEISLVLSRSLSHIYNSTQISGNRSGDEAVAANMTWPALWSKVWDVVSCSVGWSRMSLGYLYGFARKPGNASPHEATVVNGTETWSAMWSESQRYTEHNASWSLLARDSIDGDSFFTASLLLGAFALVLLLVCMVWPPPLQLSCPQRPSGEALTPRSGGGPGLSGTRSGTPVQLSDKDSRGLSSRPLLQNDVVQAMLTSTHSIPHADGSEMRDVMGHLPQGPPAVRKAGHEGMSLTPRESQWRSERGMSSSLTSTLPALYPALIIPHSESWFAVPFEKLEQPFLGSFDLCGLSKRPLLRASIALTNCGKWSFSVSMCHLQRGGELGSITAGNRGGSMQLRAQGDQHFGYIFPTISGSRSYNVIWGSQEILKVHFDPDSGSLLVTSLQNNSTVAVVTRCTQSAFFTDTDHLEICVGPNVDAVLILCCIFGVVLFGSSLSGSPDEGASALPRSEAFNETFRVDAE